MVGIGALVAASAIQTNRASDILARSQEILSRATSVVGTFTQRMGRGIGQADFHLKKGKKVAVYSDSVTDLQDEQFRTTINPKDGTFRTQDIRVYNMLYIPGFEAFTKNGDVSMMTKFANDAKTSNADPEPRNVRMMRLEGKEVVGYVLGGCNVYLDPATALPYGADFTGENGRQVQMRFQNVKLDVDLNDSMFSYKVDGQSREVMTSEPGTLRVGDRIPSANGQEATERLDRFMEGKKYSVILFFDDKNLSDSEALDKMAKLSKSLPKDIALIGVSRTTDWQKLFRGKPKFPLVIDAPLPSDSVANRFGIVYRPTFFVVDANRTVKYVQVGSDFSDLDPVLVSIGIKNP